MNLDRPSPALFGHLRNLRYIFSAPLLQGQFWSVSFPPHFRFLFSPPLDRRRALGARRTRRRPRALGARRTRCRPRGGLALGARRTRWRPRRGLALGARRTRWRPRGGLALGARRTRRRLGLKTWVGSWGSCHCLLYIVLYCCMYTHCIHYCSNWTSLKRQSAARGAAPARERGSGTLCPILLNLGEHGKAGFHLWVASPLLR